MIIGCKGKENLQAGRLTEHLVDSTLLLQILNKASPASSEPVNPVQWYYENIVIIPVSVNNVLIFKAVLPIVSTLSWQLINFKTWPVPVNNRYVTLDLPESVLADTRDNRLVLHPVCSGSHPVVCVEQVFEKAEKYPCIFKLLKKSPDYSDKCNVIFNKFLTFKNNQALVRAPYNLTVPGELNSPRDALILKDTNEYILITKGVDITIRCHGQQTQVLSVKRGTYLFSLQYPCTAEADWELRSQFKFEFNLTIDEKINLNLPKVSFINRLNLNLSNTSMIKLDLLPNIPEVKMSIGDVSEMWRLPLSQPWSDWDRRWTMVFLVAVPVGIVAAVLFVRRRRRRCIRSKEITGPVAVPLRSMELEMVVPQMSRPSSETLE